MPTKPKPYILCCGQQGRAVVYGYATRKPQPGKPVTLTKARMVLYWDRACNGLFGLAADGPKGATRITPAVAETTETVWQEYVAVSPDAAKELDAWES